MFDLQPCDQAGHYLWKKKITVTIIVSMRKGEQTDNIPEVHLCECVFTGKGRCEERA